MCIATHIHRTKPHKSFTFYRIHSTQRNNQDIDYSVMLNFIQFKHTIILQKYNSILTQRGQNQVLRRPICGWLSDDGERRTSSGKPKLDTNLDLMDRREAPAILHFLLFISFICITIAAPSCISINLATNNAIQEP